VDQNSPNLGKTTEAPAALVRVLVVDDHPVLREGVAAVLTGESDLMIVGEVRNIIAKLDARDRTHAMTLAVRRGIIQL
jgi:DNA-binding NarL/FixJ family response regulator